ncbi:MAG: hypothetical protein ACOCUA_01795 [archaeon]
MEPPSPTNHPSPVGYPDETGVTGFEPVPPLLAGVRFDGMVVAIM